MKKKLIVLFCIAAISAMLLGCQSAATEAAPNITEQPTVTEATSYTEPPESALADGTYSASFTTDSSMFHVNEANSGRGILTVRDGQMTIHISLPSKSILKLFCGSAEDAAKEGASLLMPTVDTVTYSDGISEDVHGFDIPVPAIDAEFPVALIGTKGNWYDHSVTVSDPQPVE